MYSDSAGQERTHRMTYAMIGGHILALLFGLGGLLIAVPNPHLWADSDLGVTVYQLGMQYAGGLHILFATAAMLLVGIRTLGYRRTISFFLIACVVSLCAELIGTTTGFPFGEYRYTSGLGYRILDEVPFTIPLSWFYMGLASYVLATVLVRQVSGWRRSAAVVILGATLLTIWDLVLDPAMAHQQLDVRFWVWEQTGIYFDMPAQNFLGWMLVGSTFTGISRWIWGNDPPISKPLVRVAYAIYLANLIFAMAISAAVGLWWPVLITILLGVVPATVALLAAGNRTDDASTSEVTDREQTVHRISQDVMASGARFLLRRNAELRVEGVENVPTSGPALIVARHFHHLLDGCAFLASLGRHPHILVASDWAGSGIKRSSLGFACRLARWPMVIRPNARLSRDFTPVERTGALRDAMTQAIDILARGEILVVFPEGYPTVDPNGSPKSGLDQFLPFDPGFATIARSTKRRTGVEVPVVPVGFDYLPLENGKWRITLSVGEPIYLSSIESSAQVASELQERVMALSAAVPEPVRADSTRVTETT